MPVYDYRCGNCGAEWNHYKTIADRKTCYCKCGAIGNIVPSTPSVVLFKPRWHPHITSKPLYIESKKQLKEECRKHGMTSVYLEDS